ncbi:MAG: amino acid ABC transporter substrate-binding protein [Verrucomicrobia bacterium]|nr:amino acid ABC transporter substrate-binding protein [Verrucomicrobiota bacterium]
MKKWFCYLSLLFFALFTSCSKKEERATYTIGIDPTFFPLEMLEGRGDLLGFVSELFQEVGKKQNVRFLRVMMSWDNLLEGLQLERYDAVLSVARPNVINKKKYEFSNPLFYTGPILITPVEKGKITLHDLAGKVVMIEKTSSNLELLSAYPNIIPQFYDSIPEALESTVQGKCAACLVPVLEGALYVRDLYSNRLATQRPVLSNDALRVLTLAHKNSSLVTTFNDGLSEIKTSGIFEELLSKWSLPQEALK